MALSTAEIEIAAILESEGFEDFRVDRTDASNVFIGITLDDKAEEADPKWRIFLLTNGGTETKPLNTGSLYNKVWSDRASYSYQALLPPNLTNIELSIDQIANDKVADLDVSNSGVVPIVYSIVGGSSVFHISGNELQLTAPVNGTPPDYDIIIRATDDEGNYRDSVSVNLVVTTFVANSHFLMQVDEKIIVPNNNTDLYHATKFSMFMFCTPKLGSVTYPVTQFYLSTNRTFWTQIGSTGVITFKISEDGGANLGIATAANEVVDGVPTSLGFVMDLVAGTLKIYIGGVLILSGATAYTTLYQSPTVPFIFGDYGYNAGVDTFKLRQAGYWQGIALTDQDMIDLHAGGDISLIENSSMRLHLRPETTDAPNTAIDNTGYNTGIIMDNMTVVDNVILD